MENVRIGLLGLGTIGKGVFDAIISKRVLIGKRSGVSISVKGVCDKDRNALEPIDEGQCPVKTGTADEIVNDPEVDIVVELIGGVQPAKDIILKALRNKKHVVTANKALLSEHWKEIFAVASDNGVTVNFEASVGGAIPVIRSIKTSFVADEIDCVYGILNGTTNFILTMMSDEGMCFGDALKVAQEKGIAESDPELDVSGKDSAHKLAILSLLGFGADVTAADVYTEGIEKISPQDIVNARDWGYGVKLLAIAKKDPEGLQLRVHPTLIPLAHLLSSVRNANNAIFIKGDMIEESLLFGKGAGSKPTSSSVIGDIVEIARHVAFGGEEKAFPSYADYAAGALKVTDMEGLSVPYYLRFSVIDKPGVLSGISSILAEQEISIAMVSQRIRDKGKTVPVVIMTHRALEGNMRAAIEKIDHLEFVTDKTVVIRIEE